MQADCGRLQSSQGSGDGSCPAQSSCQPGSGNVRIQLSSPGESRDTRASRTGSQSRSHGHGEAAGLEDAAQEPEEQGGNSLSELRYLLQWLHKSLPYLLILCVKLLMQHITGTVQQNQLEGTDPPPLPLPRNSLITMPEM